MTLVPADNYPVVKPRKNGTLVADTANSSATFTKATKSVSQYLMTDQTAGRQVHATYPNLLQDLQSYTWFSREQIAHAHIAFRGAVLAAENHRRDYLMVMLGALSELYHMDRALHAAFLLNLGEPVHRCELPAMAGLPQTMQGVTYPLRWYQGVFDSLPSIVLLLEHEMPDTLLAVHFKDNLPPQNPVIYAEYGMFCVKVAEWD